ncbi:uracil phosphoribosyltransferase [Mycobacterium sp. MS1601]|uniref:URC4/urg3 family protein n=1 Tax=Mycobacterium sp. MS1601 TaxID=1936029 RepID=UPI0009792E22|nr:uracil phosphoribosyltransferase [Mycobacterium sp. MS1601]
MTVSVAELRTTAAIRIRAESLLARARSGSSPWFRIDDTALQVAAAHVAELTAQRFPDLQIPFHSRWRHFEAGGVDRKADLDRQLRGRSDTERARTYVDLAVVSVLLDAGSGPGWSYHETSSGQSFTRSEGLGVASFHAFCAGLFSSDPDNPLQADAAGLTSLDTGQLARAFQVSPDNPLVGLDGRAALLRRLGAAVDERPGTLFDVLTADGATVATHDILTALLNSLSGIWLADNLIDGVPVGDCWPHPAVAGGWMPFHKLSQWLTYSLLEPLSWAGAEVTGLDALTGLPEYRNGGLLLDTGVLVLRDPAWSARSWSVSDELVVEWRALTVALIDELAPLVRRHLGVGEAAMPLACILEGGTWSAGRRLARELRDGLPPLSITSDGTVF